MKLLKKIFKKKNTEPQNVYAYLGMAGVSPDKLHIYQESVEIIKQFESKHK